MKKDDCKKTQKPEQPAPKPSRWSRFVAAVGNAIGEAKFGGGN